MSKPYLRIATLNTTIFAVLCAVPAVVAQSPKEGSEAKPSNDGAANTNKPATKVRMKIPAGTKVILPAFENIPVDPKQTLPGVTIKFPVWTGKGKVKNYQITVEPPSDKKVTFADKKFEAPPETAAAQFVVDLPEGTELRVRSATVSILPSKQVQVTAPRELEIELPAEIKFKKAP